MSNVFKSATDRIKGSGLVIPVTLVFIAMFLIACAVFYEDYSTSRLGYEALPTRKANPWVIPLIALIPQVGQVGFSYVFLTDTKKRWSGLLVLGLFLVDSGTDIYYKAHGMSAGTYIIAAAETLTVFTIGSEVMLTTAIAMLHELMPSFMARIYVIGAKAGGFVAGQSTPTVQNRTQSNTGGGGGNIADRRLEQYKAQQRELQRQGGNHRGEE